MDLICATTTMQIGHMEYTYNFYNYGNLADFQLFTQNQLDANDQQLYYLLYWPSTQVIPWNEEDAVAAVSVMNGMLVPVHSNGQVLVPLHSMY